MSDWKPLTNVLQTDEPISTVLELIDDALCHNFEFKVEDHNIYYHELSN